MKNLFKVTLLACASFFIASCTNDPSTEGVPQTPEKTVSLTIEAGTDDESRTTIVQGEDGKYQMLWNAAETEQNLAVVEFLDGDTNPVSKGDTKVRKGTCKEVNDGNTKAVFDVPLPADDMFGHQSYYYLTCYPYDALEKFVPAENKVYATLPSTQSPKADGSVDPAATMLFSEYEAETEGQRPYWLSLSYKHMTAYVKMTFTGITLSVNEKIDHIIFTANDEDAYLTGAYSYDYKQKSVAAESEADNSVTLNVSALNLKGDDSNYVVPDFTVYFATLPAKLSDFTVTVVADNNRRYTKHVTVTITKDDDYLTFETGKTRAVKINNSGFETEKQKVYKKVGPNDVVSGNNYIIISQANVSGKDQNAYVMKNNGASSGLSAVNLDAAGFTSKDEITLLNADASDYTWTFTGTTDAFTVLSTKSNTYLNASKASSSSVFNDYVPLVLDNNSQTWKLSTYSSADKYRMTIQSNTYAGDYIATNRDTENGVFYSVHSNAWTQIFMYEETDDDDDVNDGEDDKNVVYYKKVTNFEADKEYVITAEFEGVLYTMGNTGGIMSGVTKLTPIQLLNNSSTGFEKVNDNVIMRKESNDYVYTTMANGSTYAFKSKNESSYLRYSDGSFGLSSWSIPTYFTVSKGSTSTTFTVASNSNYIKVERPGQYSNIEWRCSSGVSDITFWEQTDDPNIGGEEPEEPEEEATEYKKITTKALPVGTEATPNSTPVIITVTKGGNTYVLYNVPDGEIDTFGTINVTAQTLDEAKFTTTETGISGPVSKFTWDATENGTQIYKFNSQSRTGDYAMLMLTSTGLGYTSNQYGTSFALLQVDGQGNYRLKDNNNSRYMSVDASGNLVTAANESDAAIVNLYGQTDAVEEQEKQENPNGGDDDEWPVEGKDVYQKVTDSNAITSGGLANEKVIITAEYNDFLYTFKNDNTDSDNITEALSMVLNGFKVDGDYIAHDNADEFALNSTWENFSLLLNYYYGYTLRPANNTEYVLRSLTGSSNGYNLYIYQTTSNIYSWIPTASGTAGGTKLNLRNSSGGTFYMYFDTNNLKWVTTNESSATVVTFYKYIGKKTEAEYKALTGN